MTNTTKFILIGGAVFVGVVVAKKVISSRTSSTTTTKTGVVSTLSNLVGGLRTVSYPRTNAPTASPTGTEVAYPVGGIDGLAGVSDATGLRSRHAAVPAQSLYLTDAERLVSGDYS